MKENRFWIKRIISLMLCLTMVLTFFAPVKAEAMSAKNKKAHKAYMAQVKVDKRNYNVYSKMQYAMLDIDGDNVDELITCPDYTFCSQIVYGYRNGKVVEIARIGGGYYTCSYKKTKVLYVDESGQQGCYFQNYYQMKNGIYEEVAYREKNYNGKNGEWRKKPVCTYYVKGKKTSKAKYQNFVKKLEKGKKTSLQNVKWKTY